MYENVVKMDARSTKPLAGDGESLTPQTPATPATPGSGFAPSTAPATPLAPFALTSVAVNPVKKVEEVLQSVVLGVDLPQIPVPGPTPSPSSFQQQYAALLNFHDGRDSEQNAATNAKRKFSGLDASLPGAKRPAPGGTRPGNLPYGGQQPATTKVTSTTTPQQQRK